MLHELLLALVGCTGDVFIDDKVESHGGGEEAYPYEAAGPPLSTFRVAPDLTFIEDAERVVLERLLRLGFHYHELEHFVEHAKSLRLAGSATSARQLDDDKDRRGSIYQRALATGISEVLALYRSTVLHLEQEILHDANPVLAAVTHAMHQFEVLLPELHALTWEVQNSNITGGRLLGLLHTKTHSGVPAIQACVERCLWHSHSVMYRQLSAWMVHGLLQDPHNEFFIARREEKSEVGQDRLAKANGIMSEDGDLTDWHSGFCVRVDMVPSHISLPLAESILFVGKAVRVLRNPSESFKSKAPPTPRPFGPRFSFHRPSMSLGGTAPGTPSMFSTVMAASPSREKVEAASELLPEEAADEIAEMLRDLRDAPEFRQLALDKAVGRARSIAARHLWQLVVVHADLPGHLQALKDYFLLAKGDFFQCFLEESRQLMRLPPRPNTAEADIRVPFQQAAVKMVSEDDKFFSRVSLRMPAPGSTTVSGPSLSSADGSPIDGWDELTLDYRVDWPLQLLLTKDVLAKYNKVFQYLLRLKRIQLELEKSWALATQKDRDDCNQRGMDELQRIQARQRRRQRIPMWRVRHHMTYLITNLQFYLQVDVIESQSKLLQDRLEASKDFADLTRFHNEYLAALISQSFLDIGSLTRIVDSIIGLCLRICHVIERGNGTPNPPDIEKLAEEFAKKSNSLYTILRGAKLAGSQRAPFLRQFLLRLNYNSFFEATARGTLGVGKPRMLSQISVT